MKDNTGIIVATLINAAVTLHASNVAWSQSIGAQCGIPLIQCIKDVTKEWKKLNQHLNQNNTPKLRHGDYGSLRENGRV